MNIKFPELIKLKRQELGEDKDQFGKRFQRSRKSVHAWEMGWNEAPYEVLEFVLKDTDKIIAENICRIIDEIEIKQRGSSFEEWRMYKQIRNTIRDKYWPEGFQRAIYPPGRPHPVEKCGCPKCEATRV